MVDPGSSSWSRGKGVCDADCVIAFPTLPLTPAFRCIDAAIAQLPSDVRTQPTPSSGHALVDFERWMSRRARR
jgi:hypothetical protein